VALFNRSNRVQLTVGDETVAALRVTGIFRADNVQGFVNLLESSFGVRAERHGQNEIVLYTAR
jgi:ferric-dicitrate binding protein FerR (iron transport regulator)